MIEKIDHYKVVCSRIDHFANRNVETYKLFIQLALATTGGFFWLSTLPNRDKIEHLLPLGRWIIPFLAAVTALQIYSDYRSWLGYRKAEATLLERDDLQPKFPRSGRFEMMRIRTVLLAGVAGYLFLR